MALIVTDNSVRQINAALLSLEKKIGETNSEKAQDKQVVQMELKNIQYDFMAPLYQSGNSVSINTTGTWEGNARSATTAEHAITADNVEHADTATSADTATTATTATSANLSKTLDTVNGDKLQIGSGTAQNVTNAKHATSADTATTAETANKVKNALTVNGKTYDGSSAVNAGVQTVANGGTGATTANAAANSFINSLTTGDSVPVDNDYYVSQYVNGGTNTTTYHRRPVSKLWEYIKGKISSVLGLTATNYGGKASTAGTADAFSTTYTSYITPAQAAAMKSETTIWPLSYSKDYLQTVTVTWDDYSSHTFPAGAAGMFFPGYGSNGGTLILVIYGSSRMLYNVWIDSNRWSGWHYIDLPAISYT